MESPATLNEAIAAQASWLQAWVTVLVIVHVFALVFVVTRVEGRWRVRPEPIAIFVSFIAAGVSMGWLYEQVGYVRLLGLPHLVFWTPVYVWVILRRKAIGTGSLFGKYLLAYLAVAGISLVTDLVDVIRYLVGAG